jgi:Ca-activated chloride channel family protein
MRLSLLISVSLLLAWQGARAQSADDFFNGGAHSYISNNIPQALESVQDGLKHYPDDVKLKKLYELLKQQQQSQSSQSQQNKNQQHQSQQQQSQNSSGQPNQEPQQKQNEQNQSGQKNTGQQKQPPQKSAAEKQNGEKQENQNEQSQPVAAGQMTPEEAKRLLDAQKGDEQFLQLKPQGKPQNDQQPIKDW